MTQNIEKIVQNMLKKHKKLQYFLHLDYPLIPIPRITARYIKISKNGKSF
jgi:hypothetical protein